MRPLDRDRGLPGAAPDEGQQRPGQRCGTPLVHDHVLYVDGRLDPPRRTQEGHRGTAGGEHRVLPGPPAAPLGVVRRRDAGAEGVRHAVHVVLGEGHALRGGDVRG